MATTNILGKAVKLKAKHYSTHRWFTWETGLITEIVNKNQVRIMSVVNNQPKTFEEYIDNLKTIENESLCIE